MMINDNMFPVFHPSVWGIGNSPGNDDYTVMPISVTKIKASNTGT